MHSQQILHSGSGLVELMVSIFIMGMLAASLSIPQFLNAGALTRTVARVEIDLIECAQRALASGSRCEIHFRQADYLLTWPTEQAQRIAMPASITVTTSSPDPIIFFPSGAASPQTLSFSDGNRECQIIVALRGRVRRNCDEL